MWEQHVEEAALSTNGSSVILMNYDTICYAIQYIVPLGLLHPIFDQRAKSQSITIRFVSSGGALG